MSSSPFFGRAAARVLVPVRVQASVAASAIAVAIAAAPALAQSPADAPDEAPRVLARLLAEESPLFVGAGVAVPRVLFRVAGDANAYAITLAPDVNGDGVPDVAVGFGIGKSGDNLELWSGGGFGMGQRLWGVVTTDGISGGYFGDVDQIAPFPDVNGDGIGEVLAGTWGGGRAATLYNGANGQVLQSFDTYLGSQTGWVYAVASIGDVNGDGIADFALATGSTSDAVFAVSGALTGVHHDYLWKFDAPDVVYSLTVGGDVDGDGHPDVVVGTGDSSRDVVCLSATTGAELWRRTLPGSVQHVATYPDVDGDGRDEVLAACWSSAASVVLLDGTTGVVRWTSNDSGSKALRAIPLGDIDGDGVVDVAVGSFQSVARVLSGVDGKTLWAEPAGGGVWALAAVPDVDGDGVPELAFGSFDGFGRLASGASGQVLWAHAAEGKKVLAVRVLPDLDGDQHPEVLFGGQQLASGVEPLLHLVAARTGPVGSGVELFAPTAVPIGGVLELTVAGLPTDAAAAIAMGPAPALLPLAGVGTLAVFPPLLLTPGAILLAPPETVLPLPVPGDASLVGVQAHMQAIGLLVLPGFPWFATNRIGVELTH